jgi:hypothetical protein
MSPHLPYAYSDDDEFHHPVGGWYLIDRAIAYDSWLTWRHALPGPCHLRNSLSVEISDTIIALTTKIDELHRQLPDYRSLVECPFEVVRWWEPYAGDEWASGRCCVLRIGDFTSSQVLKTLDHNLQDHWTVTPLSEPFLEFRLSTTAPLAVPGSSQGPAVPAGRPRKHRNPPGQKFAAGPDDQQLERCSHRPVH